MSKKICTVGLIIMMSLFSLVGCNDMQLDFIEEGFVEFRAWAFTSGVMNNVIVLNVDKEIVIECKTDYGKLYTRGYDLPEKQIVGKGQQEIYWLEGEDYTRVKEANANIEMKLVKNGNEIGKVYITVFYDNEEYRFKPTVTKIDKADEMIVSTL